MPWTLLILGVVAALLALNVLYPIQRPMWLSVASFLAGWIVGEAAALVIIVQLACAVALVVAGGLSAWPGSVGLALLAMSWIGLALALGDAGRTPAVIRDALGDVGPAPRLFPRLLWPFWARQRRHVSREVNVGIAKHIHKRLVVDIYRPRSPTSGRVPCLIYAHGGGWFMGFRRSQGVLMMNRFVSDGWVCVTVEYRLSPWATFPDHLIDLKRGIAWVRSNAKELGVDPDRIVIAGDSAGGHLSALAALTPGQHTWQPGFEQANTSVVGCVPCYGIYDLTHRHGQWSHGGLQWLLSRWVLKRALADDPTIYRAASPWDHLSAEAPPFLVIHGDRDSVVPVAEARAFVAEFERVAPGRCSYLELPGAQHAFNIFASRRSLWVVDAIARYAARLVADVDAGPSALETGEGTGSADAAVEIEGDPASSA